ncbi:hypothetical protein M885DRAFT_538623 [Pelagophyceae sp. CCMP2097]|nr:hypothetical protein M885DRAFT_538623 [Pelagophyceae sp. CCMP2097]
MALSRSDHHDVEEGTRLLIDWSKLRNVVERGCEAIVPVAVQDAETRDVLIVAYANELALAEARRRRVCVLWSTSRSALWIKGETSGDYLDLVDVLVNCEQNSLVYLVKPRKLGACHTCDAAGKTRISCYYRAIRPTFDDNHELPQLAFRKSTRRRRNAALLAFAAGVFAGAAAVAMRARRSA